ASRRGIFRCRSSPARSRPRSPPAMPSLPRRPNRPRSSLPRRCGICWRLAYRAMSCICCRETAKRSAPRWSPIRGSPGLRLPARQALERHAAGMAREGRLLYQCPLPASAEHGTFFAPRAFEIDSAGRLEREVFGPILHVVRWRADRLDAVCDEIAATGYALTLGIHSRIDETVRHVLSRLGVGNSYVNRTMIGAVVGVQPFGGERLSGTG